MHTQTDFAFEATKRHLSVKEAENDHIEDEIILSRCRSGDPTTAASMVSNSMHELAIIRK